MAPCLSCAVQSAPEGIMSLVTMHLHAGTIGPASHRRAGIACAGRDICMPCMEYVWHLEALRQLLLLLPLPHMHAAILLLLLVWLRRSASQVRATHPCNQHCQGWQQLVTKQEQQQQPATIKAVMRCARDGPCKTAQAQGTQASVQRTECKVQGWPPEVQPFKLQFSASEFPPAYTSTHGCHMQP